MHLRPLLMSFFIFFSAFLIADDKELLKTTDVNRIMSEIFEKHVDKKKMSGTIVGTSFKVYINQFDPQRIYLLESEVNPYINMNETDLNLITTQYSQNLFPAYIKLNETIQRAIKRERIIRTDLINNRRELFNDALSQRHSKAPPYTLFAKTPEELRERVKQSLISFINSERQRYGDLAVQKYEGKLFEEYEENLRYIENPYLYLKDSGEPMSPAAKENAFALRLLKSLASGLDAHTTVYNPAEAFDMRVRLEKGVNGIGINLRETPKGYFIAQLIKDSPAEKNGTLKIQDQLISINGKIVNDLNFNEVMSLLQGNKGDVVQLELVSHQNNKQYNVSLTKEPIILDEDRVKYAAENYGNGIIGIIRLDSFYSSQTGFNAEQDVRDAIAQLEKQGNLRGLIIDLRKNSGGFLTQAVKVAGLFITDGVIVVSKYSNGDQKLYRDMDGKKTYDGPLVVLTSKLTASAAEIVAQSLQDYGVALIVGDERTYGKGTIQSQTVTDEGGGGSYFKVTVGKYYTVSGNTPQLKGVRADIMVPSQFSHENIGEEYLDYSLSQDKIAPVYNDKLQDIDPNLKNWYMKYYMPNLQHKTEFWTNMLPTLRKNSEYRITRNPSYQVFIQGQVRKLPQAMIEDDELEAKIIKPNVPSEDDLQLREAINIVKDMVYLESQSMEHPEGAAAPAAKAHEALR